MGKGTYGSKVGRPKKKNGGLTKKQKTLPPALKKKIAMSKKKKQWQENLRRSLRQRVVYQKNM